MIKKGQVLKNKGDWKDIEIMEVFSSICAIKIASSIVLWEISYIEENYIIPAEKWMPGEGVQFFYVNQCGDTVKIRNNGYTFELGLIEIGNCTKTLEESELNAEKFKEIFKK